MCESHDIQTIAADSERVISVCNSCLVRFDVEFYKRPENGGEPPAQPDR